MKGRAREALERLAVAFGSAAINIEYPVFRRMAGRDAESIWKTRIEIGNGKRAEVIRLARAMLARLPTLQPEGFAEAVEVLRAGADAIRSTFEVTSEETYRGHRHKRDRQSRTG